MSTQPNDPQAQTSPPADPTSHGYSGWAFGRRRHHHNGMAGGVILIGLGIVFLLDNLGLISWDWAQLWPVILIVIGVALLLGRLSR